MNSRTRDSAAGTASHPGIHPVVRWIHRRRPLLTAAFVLSALAHVLGAGHRPVDLLAPRASALFVLPWLLMLAGVAVRIWGSGNLRKNQEITDTGIYRMVRHPLYLGSLCMFLAYFLALGDPLVGSVIFALMVALVYYPTMLGEEAHLARLFPEDARRHRPPRLLPDPRRLPAALESDRFTCRMAYENLGLRSLWFLLALPLFLRILDRVQRAM
jgi:protein-S-isoprenylcysteine O-methyltransferase Ste14